MYELPTVERWKSWAGWGTRRVSLFVLLGPILGSSRLCFWIRAYACQMSVTWIGCSARGLSSRAGILELTITHKALELGANDPSFLLDCYRGLGERFPDLLPHLRSVALMGRIIQEP